MLEPKVVGAGPLVAAMCRAIGLVDVLNQHLEWDHQRCRLSPGERILALIVNILTARQPLYRVWESFEKTDTALLLGAGITAADLNDDALGRALDKLFAAGPRLVFSYVCARAIAVEQVDTRFLHRDSTTRSLYGAYEDPVPGAVQPTYGYSKDKRPDLKQIVFALLANREGVPLLGEIHDGNASDKKLNGDVVDAICQLFAPDQLRQLVYVADSALVTGPNLHKLQQKGLQFLSRLPETYRVAAEVKAAAWAGPWTPIGPLASRKGAATYAASEQQGVIDGRTYRLVVYRSSHLDERKAKAFERELEQEQKVLQAEANELARRTFACRADAQAAADAWLAAHAEAFHDLRATVEEVQERRKRSRPGRPPKGAAPAVTTVYRVRPSVGPRNPERVQTELERRSAFVLITNLPREAFPADRLLQEYKAQVSIEHRFHFLKDPMFVDAFFLKKPQRIEALGYVLLMACLIFSLLERRVRRAGKPIVTPSRGKLTNPTGYEILRNLDGILVVAVNSHRRTVHPAPSFVNVFEAILQAAGFSTRIYTEVPPRPPG